MVVRILPFDRTLVVINCNLSLRLDGGYFMPQGSTLRNHGTRYLLLAGILACGGCNIFGGGPVPNPFPPFPDAGVVVRVRNEIGVIVDATIVYTDDGVEVRRTNLVVEPSGANQFVEIEKTVVDRIIALATVSAKNTSLPSNLKVGDPLFAKVFLQGADFSEGDILTIVIKSETPVTQPLPDCNNNHVPDSFEILLNPAADCDGNGELDACQIAANPALDCNHDGKLNVCENQAPVITHCAESRSVSLGMGCSATMPDLRSEVQATDNCTAASALVITQSPAAGSPINSAGAIIVTFSVDDGDGHVSACSTNVTAVDDQPPHIAGCSTEDYTLIRYVHVGTGCSAPLPDYTGIIEASDNCTPSASLVREQVPPPGTSINAGATVTVAITVRDQAGLTTTCGFKVRVVEHHAPVITCPQNVTVQCDTPITPDAESIVGIATATDNCDSSPSITYADEVVPYDPYDDGLLGGGKTSGCGFLVKRTWTARDASGNVSTCLQQIAVIDTIAPNMTCPSDAVIECGESIDPSNPKVGAANVSDNCDATPIVDYFDYDDKGSSSYGTVVTRVWFAIDSCGNYADCTQLITIVDTQPPVLTVPPDMTVQCDQPTDPSYTGCATAIDACTTHRTITHEDEITYPAGGPVCNGYIIIRHWTATDQSGNDATADQIITVVDTEAPVISECPSNLYLSTGGDCTVPLPDMTKGLSAYDNCSKGYTVEQSPTPGTPLAAGTHVVTFTVTDECENVSQCTAEVTVTSAVAGGVLFVDKDAYYGSQDGSSWDDAFTDLAQALSRAGCAGGPVDVWVAEGTYRPDGGTGDRYRSFELMSHVRVYGGFAGGETELGQRNPAANPVILSGELGGPGITDNSLHVMVANDAGDGSVLDGVTITRGNANVDATDADAGGLLLHGSSPLIRNCRFVDNRALLTGGAIVTQNDSHPIIENCSFEGNIAAAGGALRAWADSRPIFRGCLFTGNSATLGGAVEHAAQTWPTYVNCVFAGNTAQGGGAVANTGSTSVFINCTIYANTAGISLGGGMRSTGGSTTVTNCILWGNNDGGTNVTFAQIIDLAGASAVSYSCIQDAVANDGNIPYGGAASYNTDRDPLLNYPWSGKFTLNPYSPCIDAGSNAALPAGTLTDFAGNARIVDGDFNEIATVDMGALEFQGE